MKEINQYLKNHLYYSSLIHVIGGIGIGILLVYPVVGTHPMRWGLTLIAISILGHFYPLMIKDKESR